ncbi:hypothetical protein AVT97_gp25 [Sulfolobales Virus YNP2]|uniref:hypothetical protein n=1 Tax=Sulfolobales Virus YNP2 TaxID=1732180 RepID=UPI000706B990|nr:hypothetical protein AVT97_gp25 [Sulfolobales Virus YNP2]ALG97188.1 hypothetical protein [Sulfolobales Virus YNP2]
MRGVGWIHVRRPTFTATVFYIPSTNRISMLPNTHQPVSPKTPPIYFESPPVYNGSEIIYRIVPVIVNQQYSQTQPNPISLGGTNKHLLMY